MIDQLNELHDNGYEIIIHTARHMVSCDDDVQKTILRIGQITEEWLKRHGVKYDKLIFGKPYSSSLYIDDKACINHPAEIARRIKSLETMNEERYVAQMKKVLDAAADAGYLDIEVFQSLNTPSQKQGN
jgi:hypothetical protein